MALLDLPHEILHELLAHCDPLDLPSLHLTCRALHGFIQANLLLHRELYLMKWDGPLGDGEPDWKSLVQETSSLQHLLQAHSLEFKRRHLPFAATAISHLLGTATTSPTGELQLSRNIALLQQHFAHQRNIDALLCSSSLFSQGTRPTSLTAHCPTTRSRTRTMQQLSAKLHCLYGVPVLPSTRTDMPTYPYARARIYDLRQYTSANFWGPFLNDGSARTDWEKLEAVMVDLWFNTKMFRDRTLGRAPLLWEKPFEGVTPGSFVSPQPLKPPTPGSSEEMAEPRELTEDQKAAAELQVCDPYGVTGTWKRIVCFLDYSDFYGYNFNPTHAPRSDEPRPPVHTDEAIRVIRMELCVAKVVPPEEGAGANAMPTTHFTGRAWSMHRGWDPNSNSAIRGTVSMTSEGEVRWTSISVFHGEERWASEGIQVGGIKSARGVLGTWFDKDFDPQGPCGPTAFWKVSDDMNLNFSLGGRRRTQFTDLDIDQDSEMIDEDSGEDSDFDPDVNADVIELLDV